MQVPHNLVRCLLCAEYHKRVDWHMLLFRTILSDHPREYEFYMGSTLLGISAYRRFRQDLMLRIIALHISCWRQGCYLSII